ncbi:metallophosphoesterase [Aerococcus kribbianus]|uniref:Metallophosphoesterase n=1 Tax=Aerococcus kribbianus TaxID=2999064 RepID=A0A9X3JGD3_9LACT|nr:MULTISPECIES: metallophosphoesterase [unclassified Aerococcus]MCZ0717938.1 metallophosphoesterase [Aerococcus sp. YH-aer221]MCZ0726225.1 metallophosphoesterase [Aerococcus sp. YH-aer222]
MTTGVAYSFDYNGAHFTVLNTEDDDEGPMISAQQMAWLKADLQAARDKGVDWLIVSAHRPLISSSYHSLQDSSVQAARDELMQVFDNYDVDLVLNGHDHNLTVTYPLVYAPDKFASVAIDEADGVISEGDGVTRFNQANGTVMMIPSTAGTKTYDDIYDKGIDWVLEYEKIHKIIPDLSQADLDYYLSLFAMNEQPFESAYYQTGHSNAREANVQNFFTYDVSADEIIIKLYEVVGEDINNRATNLVHTYVLSKNAEKLGDTNKNEEDKQDSNIHPGEKPNGDNNQESDQAPILEENKGQKTEAETNENQTPTLSNKRTEAVEASVEAIDQGKRTAANAEVKAGKTDQSSLTDKEEVVSASALPSTGQEATILVGLAALISGCGVLFTKKRYN